MGNRNMQVIGICRFSYPAIGGFQVHHATIDDRTAYLYAPERMEERFRMFESLTLPPLRAQTDPDFTFLVVIGENIPPPYYERLMDLLADLPQAIVQPHLPGRHRDVMKQAIHSVRTARGTHSLQFRMDDDDAVSVTFVERLREAAGDLRGVLHKHRYCGIDFNHGWIARTTRRGISAKPTIETLWTPGLAIAVAAGASRGVINFSHAKLGRIMPVTSFADEDMFIRGHNDHNDSR